MRRSGVATTTRRRVARGAATLTASALVLPAAAAQAATVSAQGDGCGTGTRCFAKLTVLAAEGERNDLTLTGDGSVVVVHDDGAPLTPEGACVAVDERTVRCEVNQRFDEVGVDTRDGDDVVRTPSWPAKTYGSLGDGADRFVGGGDEVNVVGGPGDDELVAIGDRPALLRGGEGDDVLTSGAHADRLLGGPGRDRMSAGAGHDTLVALDVEDPGPQEREPLAADVVDGGPGQDLVSYERRVVPVVVDLADPAPDGSAGEADVLRGVESVLGGDAPDRIDGDRRVNVLMGGDGADVLLGRGGDDDVRAGTNYSRVGGTARPRGRDRAEGGDGDDVVRSSGVGALLMGNAGDDVIAPGRARLAPVATAVCGSGRDVVRVSRKTTPAVAGSCERWELKLHVRNGKPRTDRMRLPVVFGGAVRLTVPCAIAEQSPRCFYAMRVTTTAGRRLGRDRKAARAPRGTTLSAPVPRDAPQGVRVVVEVRRGGWRSWGGVVVGVVP